MFFFSFFFVMAVSRKGSRCDLPGHTWLAAAKSGLDVQRAVKCMVTGECPVLTAMVFITAELP